MPSNRLSFQDSNVTNAHNPMQILRRRYYITTCMEYNYSTKPSSRCRHQKQYCSNITDQSHHVSCTTRSLSNAHYAKLIIVQQKSYKGENVFQQHKFSLQQLSKINQTFTTKIKYVVNIRQIQLWTWWSRLMKMLPEKWTLQYDATRILLQLPSEGCN